jgi:hypothetical protein
VNSKSAGGEWANCEAIEVVLGWLYRRPMMVLGKSNPPPIQPIPVAMAQSGKIICQIDANIFTVEFPDQFIVPLQRKKSPKLVQL